MMSMRILLADDHKLMRDGIRALIASDPEMAVIAEAEDGESAVRLAAELVPDVIIMDIGMPGLDGIEATREIALAGTATKIIALSMHAEPCKVLEMLYAGAKAYLLKDCAFEELTRAIRSAAANGTYLSPKIAELILKDYCRFSGSETAPLDDLSSRDRKFLRLMTEGRSASEIASVLNMRIKTAEAHWHRIILDHIVPCLRRDAAGIESEDVLLTVREREILHWVKDGKNNTEISSILGISRDGVKFHLKNLYKKLNTSCRTQAVAAAIGNKVIDA
jgi:two-component system response regulator NreC